MPIPAFLAGLFTGADNPISKLIGLIPNDNEREKARNEVVEHILSIVAANDAGQLEVNRVEAASSNVFVAGWRPFIGWVCGVALAWTYIGEPVATFALARAGYAGAPLPAVQTENLFELVLAMLGMSGLRSFEKYQGVADSIIRKRPKASRDASPPAATTPTRNFRRG